MSYLSGPARTHTFNALSFVDARIIDLVAASCIRGMASYREGWGAAGNGTALAWAAGIGKLGGVQERLVGGGAEYHQKVRREKKLREIRRKGCLTEAPKNGKEFGERVHLL